MYSFSVFFLLLPPFSEKKKQAHNSRGERVASVEPAPPHSSRRSVRRNDQNNRLNHSTSFSKFPNVWNSENTELTAVLDPNPPPQESFDVYSEIWKFEKTFGPENKKRRTPSLHKRALYLFGSRGKTMIGAARRLPYHLLPKGR